MEQISNLNDGNVEDLAREAAVKVAKSEATSTQVLEALGPYLTNSSVGERKLGLCFLSTFLGRLDRSFLQSDECGFFAKFYVERIRDHHTLIPEVLRGLESLTGMANLQPENLKMILRAFFNDIHTQSQIVSDRIVVFRMLAALLFNEKKLQQISAMGSEFVLGFIQAVDAEKDPHNMRLIFSMWPVIIQRLELEPFEEDLFESMSCYFPIDFSPPKGVIGGVTQEELVLGLRKCLSCSGLFAPLAMPLLMEKLSSDLQSAKLDANLTMVECGKKYSPQQLEPHLEELWNLLKKEILGIKMSANSDNVDASCHAVLEAVTLALCSVSDKEVAEKWLEMIWNDTGRHLKDIELKFMSLSVDILSSLIKTGLTYPSTFLLEKAMPILLHGFDSAGQDNKKKANVLKFIAQILDGSADPGAAKPAWCDRYLFACNTALADQVLHEPGCMALASGIHFLTQQNASQIFDFLLDRITKENGCDFIDVSAELFHRCALKLDTDQVLAAKKRLYASRSKNAGKALGVLYRNGDLFLQDVEYIKSEIMPNDFSFVIELLQDVVDHHETLGNDCIKTFMESIVQQTLTEKDLNLNQVQNLLKAMIKKCPPSFASDLNSVLASNFFQIESLKDLHMKMLKPILCHASSSLINNGVDRQFLKAITNSSKSDSEDMSVTKASILNKVDQPDEIAPEPESCKHDFQLMIWFVKGFLFREKTFVKTKVWIDTLLTMLDESSNSDEIASGFQLVIGKVDDCFECSPSRASLARQKFFNLTKPTLIKAIKNEDSAEKKSSHLKALICQLPHVPKFVLASELATLLPLLLNGLQSRGQQEDDKLVLASLTALKDLLDQEASSFGPHLSSFLPKFLEIGKDKTSPMEMRIKALQCLKAAAKADPQYLVPNKKSTIRSLTPALDDHKRLVRQAAVAARNSWSVC